jgi:hypothetical protein
MGRRDLLSDLCGRVRVLGRYFCSNCSNCLLAARESFATVAFAVDPLATVAFVVWTTNERFNRVAGKIAAVVVVFGGSLCGLAWLTGWSVFGYLWLLTVCWLVVQPRFWL